jgi:phage terminase small subunit
MRLRKRATGVPQASATPAPIGPEADTLFDSENEASVSQGKPKAPGATEEMPADARSCEEPPVADEKSAMGKPRADSVRPRSQRQYDEAGLNAQQRRFVDHYCLCFKAKDAALEAGYSARSAAVIGHELLNRPNVAAEIQRRQDAVRAKYEVTAENIFKETAFIAFARATDYIRIAEDGSPVVDLRALSPEQGAAIGEVTIEEFTDNRSGQRIVRRVKFKKESKLAGLELLAKMTGLYKEKVDHRHDHHHSILGVLLQEIDAEARAERAREERKLLPPTARLTLVPNSWDPSAASSSEHGQAEKEAPPEIEDRKEPQK